MIRKLMLLSFILPTFTAGETARNLSFMLITSFGEFGFNSSGAVPGVDTALNRIRERQDMLPGYNLVYDKVRDSKVSLMLLALLQLSVAVCVYIQLLIP